MLSKFQGLGVKNDGIFIDKHFSLLQILFQNSINLIFLRI